MTYDGEVLRPLERTEWEQREVYAKFGLAIYFCQVLEAGLVTYLVLLRLTDGAVRPTGEEVDDLYAELFGNTWWKFGITPGCLPEACEAAEASWLAEELGIRGIVVSLQFRFSPLPPEARRRTTYPLPFRTTTRYL